MLEEAIKLAEFIASKSPVAVQATKRNIIYSMDKTNQEGLDHIVSFLKIPTPLYSSILLFPNYRNKSTCSTYNPRTFLMQSWLNKLKNFPCSQNCKTI